VFCSFAIKRSLPTGMWLPCARTIGLERLLPRRPERLAKLAVARVIELAAKLATARRLSDGAAASPLSSSFGG
jgi:hypothetical protein